MDRFDDMRARVSGSGGNSGGGGGGPFGVDVVVQATDNFNAGDTFVGTSVAGAGPTVASVDMGIAGSIYIGSADGTVLRTGSYSLPITAENITFSVKKDDSFVDIIIDLPDMTGGTAINSSQNWSINEDGSICVANMTAFLIIIHIDKDNLTGNAVRVEPNEVDVSKYQYTPSYGAFDLTPTKFVRACVRGNYLFYGINCTYVYNSKTQNIVLTMFSKISVSSLVNEYLLFMPTGSSSCVPSGYISGVNDYGDNKVVFLGSGSSYFFRVEISSGRVVKSNYISFSPQFITRNGKYAVKGKTIYEINQATGTVTEIMTSTVSTEMGQYGYVDETGQYYRSRSYKIYSINDTSGSNGYGANVTDKYQDGYFDILGEGYFTSSGKKIMLLPTSDAEYTIAHTISVSTAGDIYGVTTEAMTMGETKKALKIFNK